MKEKEIDYEVVQDEMEKDNGGNQHGKPSEKINDKSLCVLAAVIGIIVAASIALACFL